MDKKKIITIIIGIEVVIIAAIIVFLFYINSDTVKVSRQLELAQRYLLEEDYEQAIAAFEIIIEIDPKNAEAYLGLAEAYVATDDLEKAVKTLEKASKKVDSEEVLAMLEKHTTEIEQKELAAQKAAQAAAEAAQAAALAAEAAASSTVETAPTPQQDTTAAETSEPEAALRGFIVQGGELYYYDETGNYVTGWFDKNNNRYCARADGRLYKDGEHEIDSKKYLFDQGGVCLGEMEDKINPRDIYAAFLRGECECYYGEWGNSFTLQQLCKKGCETFTSQYGWNVPYDKYLYVAYGYLDYEQDGTEELVVDMSGDDGGGGYIFIIKYDGENLHVVYCMEQPTRGGSSISTKGVVYEGYYRAAGSRYSGWYYMIDMYGTGTGSLAGFDIPNDDENPSADFTCEIEPGLSYSTDNYQENSAEFDRRVEEFEKKYVGDFLKMTQIDTTSWF